MDSKLAQLDSIQTSVNTVNTRLSSMDKKISYLKSKVREIKQIREFDSQNLNEISKQHKHLDSFTQKMKEIESQHMETEQALKSEILDLKCRSMRDNLLFHKISEEKGENCVQKVLNFLEHTLKIENASKEIRLQRAHRVGLYRADKTRPIVAKFADFPDRERVLRAARKAREVGTNHGVSEQYPKEIVDKRRKLIPIMLQAQRDGKGAYIKVDKLFINKQLYRGPC